MLFRSYLSMFLSIYLSIYMSIHPSIYQSIFLSIHFSTFISIALCVSLTLLILLTLAGAFRVDGFDQLVQAESEESSPAEGSLSFSRIYCASLPQVRMIFIGMSARIFICAYASVYSCVLVFFEFMCVFYFIIMWLMKEWNFGFFCRSQVYSFISFILPLL